jgi:hypothetical protein
MMTWKEKALHAADVKAAVDREEARLREEAELATQAKAFQVALSELLEEKIAVNAIEVTIDGVTFRWRLNHMTSK